MSDPALEAWTVSPDDFPADGTTRDRLRYLIRYAILAPSSHNAQPWLFEVTGEHIDLYADRSRCLPVIDPQDRQLVMGCGAALFNLRVAARRFGHAGKVELFPEPADRDLLARFSLGLPVTPDKHDHDLLQSIVFRRTNRQPFEIRPVSHQIADALAEAANLERAWLLRLHPDAKHKAAELIAAADRIQFQSEEFRHELAHWLTPLFSKRRDGIPIEVKSDHPIIHAPLIIRTFDIGNSVAAKERDLANGSPLLVVLGTHVDEPLDWLRAGQAMQRVLLVGQVHGISASFLNQALELDEFRKKFAKLTERSGFPQLVMRMGFGPLTQPTPRRLLADVLLGPAEISA